MKRFLALFLSSAVISFLALMLYLRLVPEKSVAESTSTTEPEVTVESLRAANPNAFDLFNYYLAVPFPVSIEKTDDSSGFATAIESIRSDPIEKSMAACTMYKYIGEDGEEYGLLVYDDGYCAMVCVWNGELLTGFG